MASITTDNLGEEWLAFETGALSKNPDTSRVVPILFGVRKKAVKRTFDTIRRGYLHQKEMWGVIEMIFQNMEDSIVSKDTAQTAFQTFWPDFKDKITAIWIRQKVVSI